MIRTALLALAALPFSAPALAQVGPALDPGVMVGWAGGEAVRQDNARRSGGGAAVRSLSLRSLAPVFRAPAGSATKAAAAGATLTYTPSATLRKANFAQFVERSRAVDPDGAAKLASLFRTTDVMATAQGWMRPYGMTTSNVADAVAVYLTTAWLATRGSSDDPDPAQMRAVRGQVRAAMSATPEFRSATDAQKQELAEAMIVQAILVAQYVEAAKAQPGLTEAVKGAVAQGANHSFGFDLRSMELSEKGLH